MLCILHGWLLEGSGSNLWTRSIVTALAKAGETVHLVCQENHPERYDAIGKAYRHHASGGTDQTLERDVPFDGKCILHQPEIGDTLPVFVWDKYEEYARVVPMIELGDAKLEAYIEANVAVLRKIIAQYGITAIHANHAVLMPVVAQRVSREMGIPYSIMPHGSDIEYAVKKDERFAQYAASALEDASTVFVIGSEMLQRVRTVFASVPGLDHKCVALHLGVDSSMFDPVPPHERDARISGLHSALEKETRGKSARQSDIVRMRVSGGMQQHELATLFREAARYDTKSPDADLPEKLQSVNWGKDPTLLFTGRLISAKGIQSVIAALPLILEVTPNLRLIVVGHGPLREPMEAFIHALHSGDRALAENIVALGRSLEGDPEGEGDSTELRTVASFFRDRESRGELDRYLELARKTLRPESVLFTGYLTHKQLRFLFPCCDVGVFPSIVREAGPLVFLEALASACFPLGTYLGGMAASIDALGDVLPPDVIDIMKLDPANTVSDIATHVPLALSLGDRYADTLAHVARERYDWVKVAARFNYTLNTMRLLTKSPASG